MDKSENISDLAAALAKAQGAFKPVGKTGNNPFLKTNYVTLDGIIEMSRGPLSAVGLSYTQMLNATGEDLPTLTTMLMHASGQWISSNVVVRAVSGKGTNELQELGRSITYMKRYTLAAMLGVSSDEDTDGESGKDTTKRERRERPDQPAPARSVEDKESDPPAKFDPDNPDVACTDWNGMFSAAVEELGYKAIPHVKSTLKIGFPDGKGTVPEAWSYLVDHQAEKAKPDDTYPTRAELLGQVAALLEKAEVLGLAVDKFDPKALDDKALGDAVDVLAVRVTEAESAIQFSVIPPSEMPRSGSFETLL